MAVSGSVRVLGIVYIVKFSVEAGIIISYDHLVFTPILSQMIESFTEVAYLVSFIIRVLDKSNLKFLVGGRFKLDGKAVGGNSFMTD